MTKEQLIDMMTELRINNTILAKVAGCSVSVITDRTKGRTAVSDYILNALNKIKAKGGLPKLLGNYLDKNNLSAFDYAKMVNVTPQSVYSWLDGRHIPSTKYIQPVLDAIDEMPTVDTVEEEPRLKFSPVDYPIFRDDEPSMRKKIDFIDALVYFSAGAVTSWMIYLFQM